VGYQVGHDLGRILDERDMPVLVEQMRPTGSAITSTSLRTSATRRPGFAVDDP
jgi:hypothetical protein